jgi:hypothetical protein
MTAAKSWIDSQRADSFAKLIFARIPDAAVTPITHQDEPYDFLLTLFSTNPPRAIGVEVKGVRETPPKVFRLRFPTSTQRRVERLRIPLLLIVIDINAETAHYGWIKPPVTAPVRKIDSFEVRDAVELKKLSGGELTKIVLGIETTKEFWIQHEKGAFRLFISGHADKTFHGTILHYERTGATKTRPTTLAFDHKNFHGASEKAVHDEALAWVTHNLGPNFSVIEKSS